MRLWVPVDKTKMGGHIVAKRNAVNWLPPEDIGQWRLATKRERVWYEVNHARFGYLDLTVVLVLWIIVRIVVFGDKP